MEATAGRGFIGAGLRALRSLSPRTSLLPWSSPAPAGSTSLSSAAPADTAAARQLPEVHRPLAPRAPSSHSAPRRHRSHTPRRPSVATPRAAAVCAANEGSDRPPSQLPPQLPALDAIETSRQELCRSTPPLVSPLPPPSGPPPAGSPPSCPPPPPSRGRERAAEAVVCAHMGTRVAGAWADADGSWAPPSTVSEHAQRLLDAVFEFPVAEQAAAFMLDANPELSWLSQCVRRCPLPPCWSSIDSRNSYEATRYVDMGTGAVTETHPLMDEFIELARMMLFWRSNPDQAHNVAEALTAKCNEAFAEAAQLQEAWQGPYVDTKSGVEFWHCSTNGRSTWGDPGAASEFMARVAEKLRQALPVDFAEHTASSTRDRETPWNAPPSTYHLPSQSGGSSSASAKCRIPSPLGDVSPVGCQAPLSRSLSSPSCRGSASARSGSASARSTTSRRTHSARHRASSGGFSGTEDHCGETLSEVGTALCDDRSRRRRKCQSAPGGDFPVDEAQQWWASAMADPLDSSHTSDLQLRPECRRRRPESRERLQPLETEAAQTPKGAAALGSGRPGSAETGREAQKPSQQMALCFKAFEAEMQSELRPLEQPSPRSRPQTRRPFAPLSLDQRADDITQEQKLSAGHRKTEHRLTSSPCLGNGSLPADENAVPLNRKEQAEEREDVLLAKEESAASADPALPCFADTPSNQPIEVALAGEQPAVTGATSTMPRWTTGVLVDAPGAEKAEQEGFSAGKLQLEREVAEVAAAEKPAAEKAPIDQMEGLGDHNDPKDLVAEVTIVENAVAEKAQEKRLATEKAEENKEAVEAAAAEKVSTDNVEEEGLAVERAQLEQQKAEDAAADIAAAERAEGKRQAEGEAAEVAAAEKAVAERGEEERLAVEKAQAEQQKVEEFVTVKIAVENAEEERLAAEKAQAEPQVSDEAAAVKSAAERVGEERLAAERAQAEQEAMAEVTAAKIAAEKAEEALAVEKAQVEREVAEETAAIKAAAEMAEEARLAAEKAQVEQEAVEEVAAVKAAANMAEEDRSAAEKARAKIESAEAAVCEKEAMTWSCLMCNKSGLSSALNKCTVCMAVKGRAPKGVSIAAQKAKAEKLTAEAARADAMVVEKVGVVEAEDKVQAAERAKAQRKAAEAIAAEKIVAEKDREKKLAAAEAPVRREAVEAFTIAESITEKVEGDRLEAEEEQMQRESAKVCAAEKVAVGNTEEGRSAVDKVRAVGAEANVAVAEKGATDDVNEGVQLAAEKEHAESAADVKSTSKKGEEESSAAEKSHLEREAVTASVAEKVIADKAAEERLVVRKALAEKATKTAEPVTVMETSEQLKVALPVLSADESSTPVEVFSIEELNEQIAWSTERSALAPSHSIQAETRHIGKPFEKEESAELSEELLGTEEQVEEIDGQALLADGTLARQQKLAERRQSQQADEGDLVREFLEAEAKCIEAALQDEAAEESPTEDVEEAKLAPAPAPGPTKSKKEDQRELSVQSSRRKVVSQPSNSIAVPATPPVRRPGQAATKAGAARPRTPPRDQRASRPSARRPAPARPSSVGSGANANSSSQNAAGTRSASARSIGASPLSRSVAVTSKSPVQTTASLYQGGSARQLGKEARRRRIAADGGA